MSTSLSRIFVLIFHVRNDLFLLSIMLYIYTLDANLKLTYYTSSLVSVSKQFLMHLSVVASSAGRSLFFCLKQRSFFF